MAPLPLVVASHAACAALIYLLAEAASPPCCRCVAPLHAAPQSGVFVPSHSRPPLLQRTQLMRSIASDPEDRTEVTLLDSNTRRDMVIMKAALDRIAAASCGRMTVHYFTTDARDPSPPLEVDPPSFSHAGRIDQAAMQDTLFPVRRSARSPCACCAHPGALWRAHHRVGCVSVPRGLALCFSLILQRWCVCAVRKASSRRWRPPQLRSATLKSMCSRTSGTDSENSAASFKLWYRPHYCM